MYLKAIGDYVVLEPIKKEDTNKGGIIIPESSQDNNLARIESIASSSVFNGLLSPNDVVCYNTAAPSLKIDKFIIVHKNNIYCQVL